jgi:hypothetical protein
MRLETCIDILHPVRDDDQVVIYAISMNGLIVFLSQNQAVLTTRSSLTHSRDFYAMPLAAPLTMAPQFALPHSQRREVFSPLTI